MAAAEAAELAGALRYQKGEVIGEGMFGIVCKALDRVVRDSTSPPLARARQSARARPASAQPPTLQTNETVAVKKIWLGKLKEVREAAAWMCCAHSLTPRLRRG